MKKFKVYQQNVCPDCLQLLINGESDHTDSELIQYNKTLSEWAKTGYIPAGLADNMEPFFSHSKCDLCNGLAGDRYEYNFFQTK